jgi:hypothetical protein
MADALQSLNHDSLAYHEIRLVLASVLWTFDLSLCDQSEDWLDQKVFLIWAKGPLFVELKERALD